MNLITFLSSYTGQQWWFDVVIMRWITLVMSLHPCKKQSSCRSAPLEYQVEGDPCLHVKTPVGTVSVCQLAVCPTCGARINEHRFQKVSLTIWIQEYRFKQSSIPT